MYGFALACRKGDSERAAADGLPAWLPPVFFQVRFLRVDIAHWVALFTLAIAGWLVSLVLVGTTIRALGEFPTRRGRRCPIRELSPRVPHP